MRTLNRISDFCSNQKHRRHSWGIGETNRGWLWLQFPSRWRHREGQYWRCFRCSPYQTCISWSHHPEGEKINPSKYHPVYLICLPMLLNNRESCIKMILKIFGRTESVLRQREFAKKIKKAINLVISQKNELWHKFTYLHYLASTTAKVFLQARYCTIVLLICYSKLDLLGFYHFCNIFIISISCVKRLFN